MMGGYIALILVLWAVVVLAIAGMLFVGRWGFKIDVTPRRIWRGAFYISILSLLGVAAGYYGSIWLIRATFGGGDPGLGGMLQTAAGAFIGGVIAMGLLTYGFFAVAKGKPVARTRRWQATLVVTIFVPLLLIGVVWIVKSFDKPVRRAVNQARINAHSVSHDQARDLVKEYQLPQVPGANYPHFRFSDRNTEHYSAILTANASSCAQTQVPWREFTEMIADEVETGLENAGYEVERIQGKPKQLRTDKGMEELPDIHILGRKDGRFACYRIPYAYTEGVSFPRITMDFGNAQYYDPDMVYYALND